MQNNQYQSMIENLSIGYAYHNILCDAQGIPCDYEFVEINAAFEKIFGRKKTDVIGKKISELTPHLNHDTWISIYGKIASEGGTTEFQQYLEDLDKWIKVNVYCPEPGAFITWIIDITKEIQEVEEKSLLLKIAQDIIFEIDENYILRNVIVADESMLFLPRNDILNQRLTDLMPSELSMNFARLFKEAKLTEKKQQLTYPSLSGLEWFHASVTHALSRSGKSKYIISIREMTKQKQIEDELAMKTEELERFFYINPDLLCIADMDGNFIKVNKAWEDLLGLTREQLEHSKYLDFVHPEDVQLTKDSMKELAEGNQIIQFVNRYRSKDDTYKYIEWCSQPYGNVVYAAARDITSHKEALDRIHYLSFCDQLTGVYNRRFYEDELKRMDTKENLPLSVIMSDVNSLKLINDTFGHSSGDDLLKLAASVIQENCNENDIVCRIGGDEFAIIMPNTSYREAENIVHKINTATNGVTVNWIALSIAFGWDTKTFPEQDIDDVFKKSEERMYQRKLAANSEVNQRVIDNIMSGVYEKSPMEKQHALEVSELGAQIAEALGMQKHEVDQLRIAASLHDIGKIVVKASLLHKKEPLTPNERYEIERHAEAGFRILNSCSQTAEFARLVLYHHEWWNGTGYPHGLKGEEIPLQSRIIAVAEAYQMMISELPYRKAMRKEDAIAEIQKYAGVQFDPYISQVIAKMISE